MERALSDYLAAAPILVRRRDGEILYWSEGARDLYGYSWEEAVGRRSHELFRTEFPAPLPTIETELSGDGLWTGLLAHRRKDGRRLWTQSRWRLKDGDVVVETNTDVTEREVLSRELDHRAKNTIAVIQGLARMSLRSCREHGEYRAFEGRLQAVAEAHDLLNRHHWQHAELGEIVAEILALLDLTARVSVEGPAVRLRPQSVLAYTLALHELCSNAIRHGALSAEDGRVELRWHLIRDDERRLSLTWREYGGPAVTPPERSGYGRHLLESLLARELGHPARLEFAPGGLICVIDGPTEKSPDLQLP